MITPGRLIAAATVAACLFGSSAPPVGAALASGSVSGRLALIAEPRIKDDKPVVQLWRGGRVVKSMKIGDDGRFSFSQLEPDLYGIHVGVVHTNWGGGDYKISCPAAERLRSGIPIAAGQALDLGTFEMVRTGFWVDVAVMRDGKPVHRAEVQYWRPGIPQRKPHVLRTDESGQLLMRKRDVDPRAPIALVATVMENGEPISSPPVFVKPRVWDRTSIVLRIPTKPVESAPGYLLATDDNPIVGGDVLLLTAAGGSDPRHWALCGPIRTEAAGLFGYLNIPTGAWRLAVRAPGGAWQVHGVQVKPDGMSPTRIRLRPGVDVRFTQKLTIDGRSLLGLVRVVRERMRRDFGDGGRRALPPFGLFLVPEGRTQPTPMAPSGVFPADQLASTISVSGVEPGRYRARLIPVMHRPLPREYSGVRVGYPFAVRDVPELYVIRAAGMPPLESAEFEVSGDGASTVTLTGDTTVERATEMSKHVPPYVHHHPTAIRGMLSALGKE